VGAAQTGDDGNSGRLPSRLRGSAGGDVDEQTEDDSGLRSSGNGGSENPVAFLSPYSPTVGVGCHKIARVDLASRLAERNATNHGRRGLALNGLDLKDADALASASLHDGGIRPHLDEAPLMVRQVFASRETDRDNALLQRHFAFRSFRMSVAGPLGARQDVQFVNLVLNVLGQTAESLQRRFDLAQVGTL